MLKPEKIPMNLRGLMFLASRFGIADDQLREREVRAASEQEIAFLKNAVLEHDDALDKWLAGPESRGPFFSDEYIAFSAMRMAADFA